MGLILEQALQKGIEAHKAGSVQEADRYYTAILKANPKHPDANHNMGVLAVGVGKVEEALPFFKTALETNPSIAQYWRSYIDALIKLDRMAEAKSVFYKAKSKGKKGDGFDQIEKKLYTSSVEVKNEIQEDIPIPPSILDELKLDQAIKLAKKKIKDGLSEEAKKIYQDILKKFPKNKKALDGIKTLASKPLANTSDMGEPPGDQLQSIINLYTQAQYQEVLTQAMQLQKQFSKSINLYHIIGAANQSLGKLEEAIEAYNEAIYINPNYAESYYSMGVTLQQQGKLDQAIEAYTKALSINPDYLEAYNNLGVVLKDQGKLDKAIEAYKKALSIKPDSVTTVKNLMKCPYGSLSEQCIDIAGKFLQKYSDTVDNTSELKFLEANYLMHDHRLGLAFDRFCQANDKKLVSAEKLEALNANYHILEKKLRRWKPNFVPYDSKKLIKIFILAPPRSGKSLLETLLSKSQIIKPLSDSINLQKDPTNYSFDKLFFQNEMDLQQQGFKVITTTNPHSIFTAIDIVEQLPNSFFIFVKRDKIDVASEIFRSDWINGHEFGYSPKNIFRLIKVYNEISEVFDKKLVKNSLSISFEEILFQPRDVVSMIEKVCSISFDLQELDFTKPKIPVSSIFHSHFQAKFLSS